MPAKKKKKVNMELIGVYPGKGTFCLLGRTKGHPNVKDGNRALTSNVVGIITENTEYVLTPPGVPMEMTFTDIFTEMVTPADDG